MDRDAIEGTDEGRSSRLNARRWLPRLFVAGLIAWCAFFLTPAIFRTWFFSSDEYVVAGEIIRFANLHFTQQFFDQPETPLMLVSAALWRLVYGAAWIAGAAPKTAGIGVFTFQHLPLLFELARAISFLPGLVSIALMYRLAAGLTNAAGGCAAALMLALNPDYAWTESFIRPEPLAVCAFLAAILCLRRGLGRDIRSEIRWIFASGAFAGLAAAARFHSITATAPALLLILLMDRAPLPKYPAWMFRLWRRTLAAAFAGAILATAGIKSGWLPRTSRGRMLAEVWPKSFDTLFLFCAMAAVLIAAIWIFRIQRLLHPRILVLGCGMAAAFLAGTPTILWRPQQFFESVQMYTTVYVDLERRSWPFLRHFAWLVWFYLKRIAPDPLWMILIAAGAALILLRRDRRVLPYLIAAVLFFAARPLSTRPAPHHMLLWAPLFAILAAYAVAQAGERLNARVQPAAAAALLLIAAVFLTTDGPRDTWAQVHRDEQRLRAVSQASDWIHAHASPHATVAISYLCFNPDAFRAWMRQLNVPVPPSADERHYELWWGGRAALGATRGLVCATPGDEGYLKTEFDRRSPGQGLDPYTDAGFSLLRTFRVGRERADVFGFDFAKP